LRKLLLGVGSHAASVILAGLSFLFLTQREVYAYLDAGTGSMVFQILAGAVFASLFFIKMFWLRIKTFVASTVMRRRPEDADGDAN
jgi:hypothetical protein